jgi:hypothetical protein
MKLFESTPFAFGLFKSGKMSLLSFLYGRNDKVLITIKKTNPQTRH